jgi:hypothetical protein
VLRAGAADFMKAQHVLPGPRENPGITPVHPQLAERPPEQCLQLGADADWLSGNHGRRADVAKWPITE